MGPSNNTDAQNMKTPPSLPKVLHELDRPLVEMDTALIEAEATSVSNQYGLRSPTYEYTMGEVLEKWKVRQAMVKRRRRARQASIIAASLLLTAVTTYGAASAFRWNGFMRAMNLGHGALSFRSQNNDSKGAMGLGSEIPPPPPPPETEEGTQQTTTRITSAEELLKIAISGDQAFRPLVERYDFQGGSLDQGMDSSMLFLSMKDDSGRELSLQIFLMNESVLSDAFAGADFYLDEGSQKTVRIGGNPVIVGTSGDITTIQWILPLGFCHVWGKTTEEELLNIAKLLIDAGLKPV